MEPDLMGITPRSSGKRKRVMPIMDEKIEMSAKEIREQLQDTSDIVTEWVSVRRRKSRVTKKVSQEYVLGEPMQSNLPQVLYQLVKESIHSRNSPRKKARSMSPEKARGADTGMDMDGPFVEEDAYDENVVPHGIGSSTPGEEDLGNMRDIDSPMYDEPEFPPDMPEEQLDDDTPQDIPPKIPDDTQDEKERADVVDKNTGWSVRTCEALTQLREHMSEKDEQVSFKAVVSSTGKGLQRRKAAQQFFEMLVLHSRSYVRVDQGSPFAEIFISPGENFHEPVQKLATR
jgi:hypothetical protein